MSTATIHLSEEMKARIVRLAEQAGTTSHAFMLDAIAAKVDELERYNEFHATAEERYADLVASGKTVPWNEMRTYLEQRLAGKAARRPAARKPAR